MGYITKYFVASIFFLVLFFIVIVSIIVTPKSKRKKPVKNSLTTKSTVKKGQSSLSSNEMFKDDKENDWLAKQMKEETRIKRKDMLDLGALHEVGCDAEMLKSSHERIHSKHQKRGVL